MRRVRVKGGNDMVDLKELQKEVYDNKVAHGWNVTDMCREFCQMEAEVSEACQYRVLDQELQANDPWS